MVHEEVFAEVFQKMYNLLGLKCQEQDEVSDDTDKTAFRAIFVTRDLPLRQDTLEQFFVTTRDISNFG